MQQERIYDLDQEYLAYRQGGSKDELERVVRAGHRLVYHFAHLLTGGTTEDVVQAGMEGLVKAIVRYDRTKGATFATFASHYVMGEIRHYIRKESSYYRPGAVVGIQKRVNKAIYDTLKVRGEAPSLQELSGMLNVKEEGISEAMRAGMVSLEEMDMAKIKHVRYESFKLPVEDRLALEQAIDKLSDVQRQVIYLLFYQDLTQSETAKALGIQQRQVSRILHKSLKTMSQAILAE